MVAVPLKAIGGDLNTKPLRMNFNRMVAKPEKRFLLTGTVPIPSDGTHTLIYAGPKDHYLLTSASEEISKIAQRPIDLEGLIDYGFWVGFLAHLLVPILKSITYLYKLTGSYGVAIILLRS